LKRRFDLALKVTADYTMYTRCVDGGTLHTRVDALFFSC